VVIKGFFGPLDFSRVRKYPNKYEDQRKEIQKFYGLSYSPSLHITSFIDVIYVITQSVLAQIPRQVKQD